MTRSIAVILSGCGFLDGAEVTEATSTLIHLARHSAKTHVFAPDGDLSTVNHITQEAKGDARNILEESALICRGNIQALSQLKLADFDAIIFPGGFGVAKNLCDFAEKGANMSVAPAIAKLIQEAHEGSRPLGFFCIAPALAAKVLGPQQPMLTVGALDGTSEALASFGAEMVACEVTDFVTDRLNKVISTPAYMYDDATPYQVFTGIGRAIDELIEMA